MSKHTDIIFKILLLILQVNLKHIYVWITEPAEVPFLKPAGHAVWFRQQKHLDLGCFRWQSLQQTCLSSFSVFSEDFLMKQMLWLLEAKEVIYAMKTLKWPTFFILTHIKHHGSRIMRQEHMNLLYQQTSVGCRCETVYASVRYQQTGQHQNEMSRLFLMLYSRSSLKTTT